MSKGLARLRIASWLAAPTSKASGSSRSRRGGAGDDGSSAGAPYHDGGVFAVYDPPRRATGCRGWRSLFLLRAVTRAVLLAGRFRRCGCCGSFFGAACDLLFQAGGELVEHLRSHVLGDASPELGRASGELHVRLDADLGAVALFLQGRYDGRRGRTLAPCVAACGLEDGAVVLLVDFLEFYGAFVVGRDRADLHLHRAVVLAFVLLILDGRPWQAGRDPLQVEHGVPGLLDRGSHRELVVDLHRTS